MVANSAPRCANRSFITPDISGLTVIARQILIAGSAPGTNAFRPNSAGLATSNNRILVAASGRWSLDSVSKYSARGVAVAGGKPEADNPCHKPQMMKGERNGQPRPRLQTIFDGQVSCPSNRFNRPLSRPDCSNALQSFKSAPPLHCTAPREVSSPNRQSCEPRTYRG